MSLKSIIHDALDAAKKFIDWLLPSSKSLLEVALNLVNGIKSFDDKNPNVANFLTSIIPSNIDDVIVAKIREYLPQVVVKLNWATDETNKSQDEIIADAAKYLQTLLPAERAAMLQALWQLISNHITDDAVSMANLQKIGQVFYESVESK